jgi:hypothetical protein
MRGPVVVAFAALVLVPAALALPGKGTYRGTETATTITIAADGRTLTAVKLVPKRPPVACKLRNPVLTKLKLTSAGVLNTRLKAPNAAGKPVTLALKIDFSVPYLGQISVTYSGSGCSFAFGDALAK